MGGLDTFYKVEEYEIAHSLSHEYSVVALFRAEALGVRRILQFQAVLMGNRIRRPGPLLREG